MPPTAWPSVIRVALALGLALLGVFVFVLVTADAVPYVSGAPLVQATPTITPVPIGPDNPLGQYVKKSRLRALVVVTLAGAGLALLLTVVNRRLTRSR